MKSSAPSSDTVRVRAAGKVNLALRSGPRRPDGYHSLATVFQSVSIYDEVEVRWSEPGDFRVSVEGEQAELVPVGAANLAVKAARLLARHSGDPGLGAEIVIRKAIPVTGGMAGGSADAAGTLVGCAALWNLGLEPGRLRELGARLGADVPFCISGGTALGTGRGDQVAPVLSRGTYHWVLALSEGELSTPAVFGEFDATPRARTPLAAPPELLNALVCGDPRALGAALVNDLQPAALSLRPELATLIELGRNLGALGVIVSGSGPTIAMLAADERAAMGLAVDLTAQGACRAVKRVHGPVAGTRLLS